LAVSSLLPGAVGLASPLHGDKLRRRSARAVLDRYGCSSPPPDY
jgi:hypothetical protein